MEGRTADKWQRQQQQHGDPSRSHGTIPGATTNDANNTGDPAAVDESAWTGVTCPLHTRIEHPRLPDDADDEVEHIGKEWVEAAESRMLDEVVEATGDKADETRRPVGPGEVEDAVCIEACPPRDFQVDPGGDTGEVERHESVVLECADAETGGGVSRVSPDAEIEGETAALCRDEPNGGERLMAVADEDNQHTSANDATYLEGPQCPPHHHLPFPQNDRDEEKHP